jgi:hypothetical protein
VTKGEILTFKKSLSAYPASAYTLKYYFKASAAVAAIEVAATADGDDYLISADTTSWTEGAIFYQAFVTATGVKKLVDSGSLTLQASLISLATAHDGRSHVKRTLDLLRTAFEGRATETDEEYEINTGSGSRRLKSMTHKQLIDAITHYEKLYRNELRVERIKAGCGIGNKRLVIFK